MDFNFMAFGMIYCPSKKYQYVEEVDLIQHMAPSTVGGGENPCTTYNRSPWHSTCSLLLERGTLIDGVIFLTSFQLECTVMSADG